MFKPYMVYAKHELPYEYMVFSTEQEARDYVAECCENFGDTTDDYVLYKRVEIVL